ncbi:hypothetical protein H2200_003789 [Cladophialophora chaetospira]|uniref:DUF6536 domain-containing protein n=1 Tax=Cladophialophora chaetospira TaxID=386627 RepID=A0AA38XF23_9EURO|nr:hypothetical protein H2200_003789 [Cladophialophora chaetospira]
MEFLEPRKAYHRTQTDDFDLKQPSNVELTSLHSKPSFQSGFLNTIRDQSPLLDLDADPIRKEPSFFSRKAFSRLKVPFAAWPTSLYGWRTGALTAALLATVSLIINFVVVIWLGAHGGGSNLVELFNGDCHKVEQIDIYVHLGINVLSTLLLGGSNYCMQCLSAPTRADIDRAHEKGKFLDIGVPSVRNLRNIPTYKMLLWWALGLSSVPLHLMYNSAFYKSLSSNDYGQYLVTQDFVDGVSFGALNYSIYQYDSGIINPQDIQSSLIGNPDSWERLDNKACIKAYATNFLSNRRQLILVANNQTGHANESVLDTERYSFDEFSFAFNWICTSDQSLRDKVDLTPIERAGRVPCDSYVNKVVSVADQWSPYDYRVQYCISELVPERCSYSGNVPIVAVVLICNAVKLVVMLFVALRLKDHPLITVGDAVESFLNDNDKTTEGLCLLSRKDVIRAVRSTNHWSIRSQGGQDKYGDSAKGKLARQRTHRWAAAASGSRWSLTIGFILLALIVSSVLLIFAIHAINDDGYGVQEIGFGRVVPAAIISGWMVGMDQGPSTKILESILIANLPQTILSFLYLNLNGLLTSMWLASEWSDFANERKTLRVSKPKGGQRSTHFLQLPYKIALPLMVLSGLLHWLISQSIFLAVIADYSPLGELSDPIAIASCGFSPLAMILVIVFGSGIIIITFALGWFRQYDGRIPLVGSCSAAIAAACHQPEWDTDASAKAVRWGVSPEMEDERGVGHCAFSSGVVEMPLEGKEYAGISDGKDHRKRRIQ